MNNNKHLIIHRSFGFVYNVQQSDSRLPETKAQGGVS